MLCISLTCFIPHQLCRVIAVGVLLLLLLCPTPFNLSVPASCSWMSQRLRVTATLTFWLRSSCRWLLHLSFSVYLLILRFTEASGRAQTALLLRARWKLGVRAGHRSSTALWLLWSGSTVRTQQPRQSKNRWWVCFNLKLVFRSVGRFNYFSLSNAFTTSWLLAHIYSDIGFGTRRGTDGKTV